VASNVDWQAFPMQNKNSRNTAVTSARCVNVNWGRIPSPMPLPRLHKFLVLHIEEGPNELAVAVKLLELPVPTRLLTFFVFFPSLS
jgi:hypothetical protein